MTDLGKTAVTTAVKNVEIRLANVKEFKTMFLEELDVVLKKLADLRQMLEANRYNDETKAGFITIQLQEYYSKLKIEEKELEAMLDTEIQNWNNNLEKTKAQEALNQVKVTEMLALQQTQIQDWINPAVAYHHKAPVKLEDGTIEKLSVFGLTSNKPSFEWPDDETVKQFPPEHIPAISRVHLWQGKTPSPFLTHISFDLNNGQSQQTPLCVFDQRMDPQSMNKFEIDVDPT